MKLDWLRLFSEARNDAKLRTLSAEQFRVWFNLLCFAGEQPQRGSIEFDDLDVLAVEVANADRGLLDATLERLCRLRIVACEPESLRFLNWDKRQYEKPSDRPEETAVRKREQRERERQGRDPDASFIYVTPTSRDVTPGHAIEAEEEADTESDTEQSSVDPVAQSVKAPLVDHQQKRGRKRAAAPPSDAWRALLVRYAHGETKGDLDRLGRIEHSHDPPTYEQLEAAFKVAEWQAGGNVLAYALGVIRNGGSENGQYSRGTRAGAGVATPGAKVRADERVARSAQELARYDTPAAELQHLLGQRHGG